MEEGHSGERPREVLTPARPPDLAFLICDTQFRCQIRLYVGSLHCATQLRYLVRMPDELDDLDETARAYERTGTEHEKARLAAIDAVVAALRAGHRPAEVARRSPFTDAYVRTHPGVPNSALPE